MLRSPHSRLVSISTCVCMAALCVLALRTFAKAEGTWVQAPVNPTTGGQAFGLWLMTDGTILSHGSALNNWVILSPDSKGDYSKGKWKSVAGSTYSRGGAVEHVLKDGRFLEAGGEYIYIYPGCSSNCAQPGNGSPLFKNTEIYDPVANVWKVVTPALYEIADTGTATLSDGRVFSSSRSVSTCQIYDPDKDTWTKAAPTPLQNGDENSWSALQNGGILAVGYKSIGSAIYDPANDKWTKTGPMPSGFNLGDTAGISLMFDGRVIAYGMGQTYIYTPGPTASDPGTWISGPKMLDGDEAEDEYSNTLPNGKVWAGLVKVTYGPGVILQEFDPETNTVTSVKPPPDKGNPYPIDYVNLPNGQVMVTAGNNDWIYTPDTQPKDEWRPRVTSVTFDSGNTYTLTGTQISGLINGADEGDDMTMAENYPIVWLTDDSNNVFYCRTFNFSSMVPSVGDKAETCQFTTPAGLPEGSYSLHVAAVGVQSKDGVPFSTGKGTGPTTAAGAGGTGGDSGASGAAGGGDTSATAGVGGATAGAGAAATAGVPGLGLAANGGGPSAGTTAGAGKGGLVGTGGTPASSGEASGAKKSSGCSCNIAERSSRSTGWASLGFFALAWLRLRSRRRQAH